MKTQNGFTLMNKNEIASYLAKQKVTRKISKSGYYVNKKIY